MENRRDFIKKGLGILGVAVVAFKSRLVWAKKLAVPLDKVPALKKVGGWVKVKLAGEEILLVRDGPKSVKGLHSKCTHQNCPLEYNAKSAKLDCTCHGSSFDLNGKVLKGPAAKNLKSYPIAVEGERLVITIE